MEILILGIDGYIGYPLSLHLERKGHTVWGLDNFSRRSRANSLTPNRKIEYKRFVSGKCGEIPEEIPKMDAIVHLAEQPSAPWSMASAEKANITQRENVLGTLDLLWSMRERMPNAHLVKLGSMGEYGTPEVKIPEGFIEDDCPKHYRDLKYDKEWFDCPMRGMSFPKQPGSFYHLSKVFDSMNIEFACKTWGLKSTDVMQGVVFGLNYWDQELTRFDYDQYFGTAINRFCAQAIIGHPLTVYGKGKQQRGFLPLSDSIECLTLAIENPPENGEYRVFNQYAEILSINKIAETIAGLTDGKIIHINNPRIEKEDHGYESTNEGLRSLGYDPQWSFEEEIKALLKAIKPFANNVDKSTITPTTTWK